MDQEQEAWTVVLLASLRAENTQLWEIVRAVADANTTYYDGYDDQRCVFCLGEEDYTVGGHESYKHEPHCVVLKAWALVEQAKRGNR